jgi:hypothetical protein
MRDKNILFVYISFFGYEKEIIKAITKKGGNVIAVDERISNCKIVKIIYRFFPKFSKLISFFYFFLVYQKVKKIKKVDFFFVLKGEVIPYWFIKKIKSRYSRSNLIYYTWDSFENNSNGLKIYKIFDRSFTFDIEDSKNYKLIFRPLFSVFTENSAIKPKKSLAGTIITAHSDRISVFNRIKNELVLNNIETKYYLYSRIKFIDRIKKFLANSNQIVFNDKPLTIQESNEFLSEVKFVIDINHPQQTGLTIRTIEALVNGKKLITTNSSIRDYCFFNETNICIVDRLEIKINESFLNSEFMGYSQEITQSLTIDGWIEAIFFGEKVNWKTVK